MNELSANVFVFTPFSTNLSAGRYKQYKKHFMIPYIIFLRDTQSYLILLGLHFAICFEPTQLPFSGLEWAILVFMTGRLFTEITQYEEMAQKPTENEKRSRLKALCNYLRYVPTCYCNDRSEHEQHTSSALILKQSPGQSLVQSLENNHSVNQAAF